MSTPFDLVVVGRPSVDVIFTGLHEWPSLGHDIESDGLGWCVGTSFNLPAAANRVGLRVGYIATIGNDVWSDMIRDEFDVEGLPTDFLEMEERPLPGVSVAMNYAGDRGFVTHWGSNGGYDDRLAARAIDVVTQIDALHLHAYVDEQPELQAVARGRGMSVSLDSWGGSAWSSERPLPELLSGVDVVFANEDEAVAMTGETEPERALGRLAEHCGCAVIRLGRSGAIGTAGGRTEAVPAETVELVDTTGAGDCFNAGFLAGWLGGLELEESLTLGVICGSGAVGNIGGYRGCPREDELRSVAASRGITLASRASEGDAT